MKRFEISLLLAVIFCSLLSFISFENECEDIRSSVLRMHVLANSDSDRDQMLKLLVRDRLLEISDDIFDGCDSYEEALDAALDSAGLMADAAAEVLRENGCSDEVSVCIGKSYFSTRTYGSVTLPAGIYEAVQVKLGSARGHNWWCVMFPAVCLPCFSQEEELETVLSDGQLTIVSSDGYELKFRCVELYEEFLEHLRIKSGEAEA